MIISRDAEFDSMDRLELLAAARSLRAEVRTLRTLRQHDRAIATQALQQIQGSDRMPPRSAYGCPSEAH